MAWVFVCPFFDVVILPAGLGPVSGLWFFWGRLCGVIVCSGFRFLDAGFCGAGWVGDCPLYHFGDGEVFLPLGLVVVLSLTRSFSPVAGSGDSCFRFLAVSLVRCFCCSGPGVLCCCGLGWLGLVVGLAWFVLLARLLCVFFWFVGRVWRVPLVFGFISVSGWLGRCYDGGFWWARCFVAHGVLGCFPSPSRSWFLSGVV